MKKILIVMSLFLLGCEEELTAPEGSSDTVALVWMYKGYAHINDYGYGSFPCDTVNNVYFSMPIMGSSMETVDLITINQISLEEEIELNDYNWDSIDTAAACQSGWGHFYQGLEYGHTYVRSNTYSANSFEFDQINLNVNTNQSLLSGVIDAPGDIIDSLTSYAFSADSSSIVLNWNDANADFYEIDIGYQCYSDEDGYDYRNYEYYVTSNTYEHEFTCEIIFDNWYYPLDIFVKPTNGPLPEEGAIPNMSGGNGYLYYSSYSHRIYEYYSSNSNQKDYMVQDSEKSVSKVLEILNLD
tara:strand:- start:578 stop:1471 length:894 start_codon:yes stop_codon:yes gene_type:complete